MEMAAYRSDCASCFGLCCVALPYSRSADFPESKPAGRPCRHLGDDFGCRIHDQLDARGWRGCVTFECFGAGQLVSRASYGGVDWRSAPGRATELFEVFRIVRQLQEMRYLLEVARSRRTGVVLDDLVRRVSDAAGGTPEEVMAVDVDALRDDVRPALRAVSAEVRRPAGRSLSHADLAGRSLLGEDLSRADLRGAVLVGADLREACFRDADVLGADLRGADVRGADLRTALFLTQPQINSMRGDSRTELPTELARPAHW